MEDYFIHSGHLPEQSEPVDVRVNLTSAISIMDLIKTNPQFQTATGISVTLIILLLLMIFCCCMCFAPVRKCAQKAFCCCCNTTDKIRALSKVIKREKEKGNVSTYMAGVKEELKIEKNRIREEKAAKKARKKFGKFSAADGHDWAGEERVELTGTGGRTDH